nr:retrotransposon protein, putative, Ty1-copia subclass [Tanacetum cinerariifolium]
FEEDVFDDGVQRNEAIPLSDEEIALDANASSEGTLSPGGPRSMFEREKLSGNNFNDWFRQLKLVLRVEKKMFVIEQPIPPAPAADSEANVLAKWNALYDVHNEVACLMLGSMTPELHRQFENYSSYEMLQELRSMLRNKLEWRDNCHYAPSITRGVVSVHRLIENGFVQCITDYGISVSKNNVFYFFGIPSNGIYKIDMHDLVLNVNSSYNVSTKRAKHNLDSTYLWHRRLAHISKKHIEKLQQEGLLRSTDDESFDQCVSCLSGKMTRKSFPHRSERATDLLGIIHTDVCGPFRNVSRQCASYFITFTDDYSRYGYVYLLKHKREVFETFKVFKNEVKNQLEKTIKALRLDRGGEYISQEFKDCLKARGIIQQLTPPYTPQHNGVSERRNLTLLDMVRSMMNLTTLLLSF